MLEVSTRIEIPPSSLFQLFFAKFSFPGDPDQESMSETCFSNSFYTWLLIHTVKFCNSPHLPKDKFCPPERFSKRNDSEFLSLFEIVSISGITTSEVAVIFGNMFFSSNSHLLISYKYFSLLWKKEEGKQIFLFLLV
jgi:hypothetical protein